MATKVIAQTADMPYDEWLELRRQGIGGSDASVVCGFNRYKSQMELWLEKTGQMPVQPAGEAAYWGTQLEDVVRQEFSHRTGIEVTRRPELLQSGDHPFMLANVDGICMDTENGPCIFEAKTASAYKAQEWVNAVPDEYQLQVQHYMAVTDCVGAYVAVLIGGNTFRWHYVERDDELISMIVRLEADFWQHVKTGTPPPVDGTEAAAQMLADRFADSVPKSQIVLPSEAADLLAAYDEACEQLELITEDKRKAENRLKEMLGENETGTYKDRIVTWKPVKQERLDSKALKAEHPDLCSQYTKQSVYRRFSVKKVS